MARTADDTLGDLAMRFIVRQPNRTLTPETITRADKIIQVGLPLAVLYCYCNRSQASHAWPKGQQP
jgi:hypothetical protein